MVTYVQNKLIKVTIIVDRNIIGFNAHCALETRCVLATSCDVFYNPDSNCFLNFGYGWTVRRLWVTVTNLGQRKHNEFGACALLVPNVRLALV